MGGGGNARLTLAFTPTKHTTPLSPWRGVGGEAFFYFTSISSTSNTSVAKGGMDAPAPRSP